MYKDELFGINLRWKSFKIVDILITLCSTRSVGFLNAKGDVEDGVSVKNYPDRTEKRKAC
ncbi:hypothetical protein BCE02nite_54220 [Brevibacillus centrosporus]|nr:hypothetical protein BCE02nite_54220 [Brevibacillus centrosporus]